MADVFEPEPDAALDNVSSALRVVSRHLAADCDFEDNAAAIAALAGVLIEDAAARREADRGTDFWLQSARGLRTPITVSAGGWQNFPH